MNRLKWWPFMFMLVCLFTASFVYAQDDTQKTKIMVESEIVPDMAFALYVDFSLISKAVFSGDADLLTDVALQLANAERTLMRYHKSGITSEIVLIASINLAKDNRDNAVLERLAKIAESLKNKSMEDQVAKAQKLASTPEDISPDLMVSVKEMSPEDYAAFHKCLSAIQIAKVTGDATWLQDWEIKYGYKQDNSKHYIYVKNLIEKTLAELPNAEVVNKTVLSKLAEESRGENESADWPGRKNDDWNKYDDKNRRDDKNRHDDKNRPDWNKPDYNHRPDQWRIPNQWNRPGQWNRPVLSYSCNFCKGLGSRQTVCGRCNGTGRVRFGWWSYRCSSCSGDGRISSQCSYCNGTGRLTRG